MRSFASVRLGCAAMALVLHVPPALASQPASAQPRAAFMAISAREETLRRDLDTQPSNAPSPLLLRRMRDVVGEYERMAAEYPLSGYSDNALWQAGLLSADAYWNFGEEPDRVAALRLLAALGTQFPTSSLNRGVESHVTRLRKAGAARGGTPGVPASLPRIAAAPASPVVTLTAIRRESLPDALRLILELDREIAFHDERVEAPARVFIDLPNTKAISGLKDATLSYTDDVVRQVRVNRSQSDVTRVALDLQGAGRHSVYQLYQPYRIVIDIERGTTRDTRISATRVTKSTRGTGVMVALPAGAGASRMPEILPSKRITAGTSLFVAGSTGAIAAAPAVPMANSRGRFSLSRQLGLGVSRVVIDAGHGGHDPGARVKGLNEADVVLDVALRLEKLLLDQPGVEVVLTRRSNVYVPLEQRTAIANREGADLFLSIHANASENPAARGLETYFLNFAANPEAERIAARENAGAARTMHSLPEIVKAIALNNKIDESRDFATLIQRSMYDRLRKSNRDLRDLGVKQAPFMVLIGATMPSVLAEISFITNRDDAGLLKTTSYRQLIAESLLNGIMRYQKALKTVPQTVAAQ